MAGSAIKKRSHDDSAKSRGARPSKKQKKSQEYHSSDSEEDAVPPHLMSEDDGDEFVHEDEHSESGDSESQDEANMVENSSKPSKPAKSKITKVEFAKDAPDSTDNSSDDADDADSFADNDSFDLSDEDGEGSSNGGTSKTRKSKRNDEAAFASSISKILSSKLSSGKRSDPIVARSAASQKAAREAVDAALELKARRRLREEKRLKLEKGRVRDVLVASTTRTLNVVTGEVEETVDDERETTAQILETERRLRKVAQRGVVKLFNAVRSAQVKAAKAVRETFEKGLATKDRKKEKVTEMSKKGFLELIASGGGGLKKGGLEEA